MQWNGSYIESTFSFANNINTHEGGTHLSGFKAALTRTLNDYARAKGLLKEKDEPLTGDDSREGLTAIVSVKLREPQFEGQTKTKLGNPSIRGLVETSCNAKPGRVPRGAPERGQGDRQQADLTPPSAPGGAQGARPGPPQVGAGRRRACPASWPTARDRDPANTELFLVEGDCAGGSAVDARDRSFQAILPLRGKIINVEKARIDKVLSNNEIQAMITAMGTGIGEEFDVDEGPVPQARPDLRRRRGRRPHPHADPDLPVPAHAGADRGRATCTSPARRSTRSSRAARSATSRRSPSSRSWLIRERLDKIGSRDRDGRDGRAHRGAAPALQRALKEHEGWAGKLSEQFGTEVVASSRTTA